MKGRKVGVYIPPDLEKPLEAYMKERGVRNISRVVQEALRLYLSEVFREKCTLAGFINVLYNHEVGGIDTALTDLQHDYMDVVVVSNHVHVSEEQCLLSIAVKGDSSRILEFVSRLHSLHGVLLVKPMLLCTET
ncbi:MAG: CopG family ribbon-helix-helix protein [Desulfurococcaceae archaeon]